MKTSKKSLVSVRVLNGLDAFLKERKRSSAYVVGAFGIDVEAAMQRNAYVDLNEMLRLFEIVAMRSRDEAFGLHFAEAYPLASAGLSYYAAANAPTLREAMKVRASVNDVLLNCGSLTFSETSSTCRFSWDSRAITGPRRQFIDYMTTIFVMRTRIMLDDTKWTPTRVELPHARPCVVTDFERVLGPSLVFNAPEPAVFLDRGSLSRRLPKADPALHRAALQALVELSQDDIAGWSIVDQARLQMIKDGRFNAESEQSIARALNISVRTLQRELADGGTTFRAVVDCARKQAALQLLHDTDLPLTEVAFRIGFSELSSFSRAAKKWFGKTAGEVRAAQQDWRSHEAAAKEQVAPRKGRKSEILR